MNWIFDIFKGVSKEASVTNQTQEFERKVQANDWITETMNVDEAALSNEQQFQEVAHLLLSRYGLTPEDAGIDMASLPTDISADDLVQQIAEKYDLTDIRDTGLGMRQSALTRIAAYEMGETAKETLEKDYERNVKALSDYALAEMLAEYRWQGKGLPENFSEEKEKAKKKVSSSRGEAENELLKLVGDHTSLDWKEAFAKWRKEERIEPKEGDIYTGAKPETGKQNWEKKESFEMPSDKERIEGMEGVGSEEKKGQVGKEASLEVKADPMTPADEKALDKMVETDIDHSIEQKHAPEQDLESARRGKTNKELENIVQHAVEGYQINIMDLSKVQQAAEAAWAQNPSAEYVTAAVRALLDQIAIKTASTEIASQASREEVIKKIAEIDSPWKVIKDDKGQEVIARVEPETNIKESEENEDETIKK